MLAFISGVESAVCELCWLRRNRRMVVTYNEVVSESCWLCWMVASQCVDWDLVCADGSES